jgi:hypothetical protein
MWPAHSKGHHHSSHPEQHRGMSNQPAGPVPFALPPIRGLAQVQGYLLPQGDRRVRSQDLIRPTRVMKSSSSSASFTQKAGSPTRYDPHRIAAIQASATRAVVKTCVVPSTITWAGAGPGAGGDSPQLSPKPRRRAPRNPPAAEPVRHSFPPMQRPQPTQVSRVYISMDLGGGGVQKSSYSLPALNSPGRATDRPSHRPAAVQQLEQGTHHEYVHHKLPALQAEHQGSGPARSMGPGKHEAGQWAPFKVHVVNGRPLYPGTSEPSVLF